MINKIENSGLKAKKFKPKALELNLIEIKAGVGSPVIFIDGFLTEEAGNTDDWESQLKAIYPDNPWLYVSWESDSLRAIGTQIGVLVGSRLLLGRVVASATPVGWPLAAYALLTNPWTKAYKKAKQVGVLLGDHISADDQNYILCGHSLGARVIYFALQHLVNNEKIKVEEVHLLGGAVSNNPDDWKAAKQCVIRSINNYTSQNDKVLSTMYRLGTAFMNKPIGIYDIEAKGVNNIDVSHIVNGHTEFKKNFSSFIKQ